MNATNLLTLQDAARHIGCSTRWMRRWWPILIREGVRGYRIPKGSIKGRLMFEVSSLDAYLERCRIQAGSGSF